jgi:hypothetical protein
VRGLICNKKPLGLMSGFLKIRSAKESESSLQNLV